MKIPHVQFWATPHGFCLGFQFMVCNGEVDLTVNLGWVHASVFYRRGPCPCCGEDNQS